MCRSYYNSFLTKWHHLDKTPNKAFEEVKVHHHIDEAGCKGMNDKKEKVNREGYDDPIISSPEGSSHHSHRSVEGSSHKTNKSLDDHQPGLLSLPSMLLRSMSRKGHSFVSSPRHHNLLKSPMKTSTSSSSNHATDGSFSSSSPKVKLSPLQTLSEIRTCSRNISRMNSTATPIVFSQSTAKKRAPPIKKNLECTLEELSEGCVKQFLISRDVIINCKCRCYRLIEQEGELVSLKIKPGWKKRTKITFIGKGDERPGYQPADLVFLIKEKEHPLFRRVGDDLECEIEIPLVQALTGCNILVPLLGDRKMSLSLHNVIYPGYTEVIKGEGMPKPKEEGKKGDLRINFSINFPTHLTDEQRFKLLVFCKIMVDH